MVVDWTGLDLDGCVEFLFSARWRRRRRVSVCLDSDEQRRRLSAPEHARSSPAPSSAAARAWPRPATTRRSSAPPSRCPARARRPRRGRAGPHRGGFHERGGILAVQAVAEEPAGGEGGPHLREAEPEANPHPGEPRYCLTVLNPLHFSIKNELRKQIFFA